ncbi:MAG: hypothetical protein IPI07_05290 [Flavobacteriales bacterium]|nr:hypothetical protein [Flavobacteriales bacterium]MBK9537814.1 hypothetical protein [Flavobacteriales bacterium]
MERSAAVSELGSMRNLKYFVRPFVVLLCMLHGRHIHAQHDMRYLVGDWHFNIWSTPDISAPPALTGTLHLESGLDSALALVGRVVLNDGPSTQGGNFTRELIAFDAFTKLYTRTIATNTGSHYVFTSTGWLGGKLKWTGSQHAGTDAVELREEIERTGPDRFNAVFTARTARSGWCGPRRSWNASRLRRRGTRLTISARQVPRECQRG